MVREDEGIVPSLHMLTASHDKKKTLLLMEGVVVYGRVKGLGDRKGMGYQINDMKFQTGSYVLLVCWDNTPRPQNI